MPWFGLLLRQLPFDKPDWLAALQHSFRLDWLFSFDMTHTHTNILITYIRRMLYVGMLFVVHFVVLPLSLYPFLLRYFVKFIFHTHFDFQNALKLCNLNGFCIRCLTLLCHHNRDKPFSVYIKQARVQIKAWVSENFASCFFFAQISLIALYGLSVPYINGAFEMLPLLFYLINNLIILCELKFTSHLVHGVNVYMECYLDV